MGANGSALYIVENVQIIRKTTSDNVKDLMPAVHVSAVRMSNFEPLCTTYEF